MHVSSRADYAVRACIELARNDSGSAMSAEVIAMHADLPGKFLETILTELRHAGIIVSQRGPHGGCRLARPAAQISVADVVRAVEGPIGQVRGTAPEQLAYPESGQPLRSVWVAMRAATRDLLENVSLAQLASGALPRPVEEQLERPGAWGSR